MLFKGVAIRQEVRQALRAVIYLEELVTGPAEEMVVMALRCHLPAWRLSGQIDPRYASLGLKGLQITIDGGDSKTGSLTPGQSEYLID